MPVGKSRQLTDFEKNLKEEIYKRDNHIDNSVKYAIDTGQDYGVSKDTPQWRRDAINKYRDSHKVEIYDDNGNLVGTVGYEAHKAINKNKVFDYKGKNDEERKVFSYLRQRQNREARKKEQREYVKNHMSNPEIEKLKFDYNPKTSMSRDEYNAERQRRKDNKDAASNTGKVEFVNFRDTKTARERLNSQSLPEFVNFRDVKSATEKLKKQNTEQLPEFGSYKYYENQADEKAKELEEIDKYINDNYSLDDINIWQNAKEGVRDAGENAVKYNSDEKLKGIDNLMSRKADILDDYVGAVACLEAYEGRALKFKEDGSVDTDNVRFVSGNQKKRYEVMEKYGGSPAPEYMKTPRQPNEELNGELAAAKGEEEKQTVLKKIDRYQKDMLDPTLNKITETVDKSKKNVAVLNDNIDAANYYDKNKDNKYGDGVFGRIAGNYRIGDIGEERAMSAFNSYAYSDSDLTATQIYDELSRRIQERNKDTFTNTKAWQQNLATIAQYVPQGRNQAIARLKGAAVGSVIPLVGSKTGGDAAAAMYMFKQTAGNMYADLILEEGLSPEEAKKLSANNALWSGVVEYGLESALGGVLKGIGKGVKKIAPTEKVIKVLEKTGLSEETAKKAVSAAKTAGNYAVGIFGEGAEEWIQQGGEIVTKRYAAKGESASALKIAAETFDFSKYTDEDFDEMNEAFKGGAVIGFASTVGSRAAVNLAQSGMDKLAAHSDNKAVGKAALTVSQPDVLINRAIDAGLESSDEKTVGRIQKLADKYKSGNASAAEVGEIIKTGLRTGYEQAQNLKVTEDTQTNDDVALPTQDTARQSVLAAANSGNSESSVISPSVTAAANVSERQMHDVKENLSEGGAAQSVEQVQNAVKKVTNTMINEFKNSNIKNIPDYQAAYNENLRLSTTKGATIDKDFIKTYANQYAEGLKRNNSKAYKELASVSDDVGSMLTDYLISNRIPQGIGDISALAQAGGELRSIVGKAAQTTLAMNGKIYNDTDRVSAISNEISNGNFAVVDGANDGNIALAKVGEYYEAYGADAVALAKAFNVSTHYIQKNGRKTLVAAVPSKYIGEYAAKSGYSGTQYSAGGNEYIYLTKDAERGNLSADAVRSDITAEGDSDFIAEIEKNGMIELDERPSESKIETIAAQVERDNTIPVYLDGVDKLGEVLLVYANEEDVTRNMVKTDINSYYDGVMPERGIPLSENTDRHYDEDTIEISERPSEYDADSYALVVELDRTIPILLNGVDELGEVELNYSNEENVTRDMVKSDIDAYYSGTMPEHGVSLSNNYDPDIKFSVESVDGTDKKYVKADRQVISGDNPEEWRKQVYNYINSSIRKGKDINVLSADGDVLTITEDTAGKARFRNTIREPNGNLRKMTNEEFAVKLRAESHIDEIAEVSKKNGYSAIDTKNHHFAKDGFYYRTAYFEDFDGKYYKLTLSVGKSGEINTVYNVGKLKETYGRARDSKVVEQKPNNARRGFSDEAVPFKTASETNIGLRGGTPSDNTNISQNDDIVNSNIRENSGNDTVSNAKSAENHFGTTNDFKEAGYITVNGQMLDFSGRHWGGTENGMRTVDHGDIAEDENISYFKDGKLSGADAVQRFLDDGNIRILDERGGINLSVAPNAAQTDVLKDFINSKNGDIIIDITDERGLPKQNFEYGKGTSAQKIISDINSYFDNGTVPQISELNKFRYSLDGGGIIRYNDDIDIPYRESKQLSEYIMSENNRNGSRLKPSRCKEIGDNFYFWRNNSKTDYDVIAQVEIDGNEDIIDLIRKGFENGETHGIDDGTKRLDEIVAGVRDRRRGNSGNNAVDTAELSNGNDDRLYSRQSSDDDGIKFDRESNRNQQNTEVGNYGRDDILNGNDRRTLGESERERGSGVQEIAGDAEGNASEEQSSASSRRIYARDVKEAGGVERRNDRGVEADFVKSEYYNDEMRRIAAENDERGVVTHFILGNGRAIEYGTNFRGAVRGNEVYIQADHGKYSPTQINRHEIIHRNYSSDTVQELKNRIKSRLTNEQIRDIAERLYRDYAQKRRSFDEIFEEFVCDVMADMNDYAEMFETETREYWAAEEQDRKGYSPSTYTESIDAGGKNVAENKSQQWSQSRGLQLPKLADTIAVNNNISQNDNIVNDSSGNTVKSSIAVYTDNLPVKYRNKNEARKEFVGYARENFPKSVVNNDTKSEIGISRTGIDKFLSGNISIQKYATGFKIPELIESAVKVGEAENQKGKTGISGYEYYYNTININNKDFAVHIRVRNTDMGDKYYGHTISQNVVDIEIEPLAWNSDKKSVHSINAFGSNNTNISQNDNIVKSSMRENSENDTDIRFSTDENTDVDVSTNEDMSYLSEPVRNIRNDINEVINRADLKKGGKVYDRAAAVRVRDSILDNISIGDIQGIDMRTKKDRAVMTVLVSRALNSAGVDAKRKSARDLTRYIAQNASVYDADSLCADGGVDYEGDRAVILNYIKHGVKISPDAKEAIISAVGENSARGYIAMMSNNSALGIDSVYDELSVALPGYFASDALTEGEKMRRVIDVYTWLKDGKSMQDVKLIDVMTPDDARAFTELVQKQLELAFDTMGRDSAISREIAAERAKYEQRLSDIREKYEAKIADMRNSAKKKQSDGAKAKNISTEQTGNRFKNLAEAAKKYGAIKKGANAVRDIEMPKRIDDNRYVSRFARTMAEAGVTPDESLSEFERDILDGKMTYERITDEEAKKSATDKIMRRGFMQALDDWNEMILSNQRIGKNEMALGQTLYNQCINAKDAQNAMKIAADLANIATQAGQTVQACALIKQMSPDCQLYSLEQSVEKMKREFENKRKFVSGEKRKIDLEINEELAQKLLNAKTEDERRAVMDEILQDIANQIPSTLKDKWDSWRYLSMLGNPRTHIRNIGGNAVFMLPVKVKNAVGWILEKTISKDKRTKSLKPTKDSKNFAAADYAKMKDIIQGSSGKYEELSKINELRRIYKFKPLEWLRKANFAALEWEDGIFLKHHYVNAMAQFLTARGYTSEFMNSGTKDAASVLENARAYAMSEAQKATYRDANAIAETLSRWQRNLQNNDKLGVRVVGQAVEGIVPFKKTPLNIAKRGVEYSPIGLISGLYDAAANIKSGKVTAAQAIDKIASGLTGTGLVILGMGLSKLGLVRGDDDDDDKLARLDSATGEQSYSFKIGNHSYTIDWVAPASMPFFMGVSMWNAFEKTDKFTFEEILNAVLKIPAPLLNLSVLSSLNDLIRAGDYSSTPTEKMADYAWQATTSYVGQAFPTVMGQITRTVDKTKRNASFTDPDNGLPAGLDRFIARQATKIPGLSKILEPKIDMWGREETYGDTWYGRLIGNMISPGYYKEINSTALDDELRRLGNEYEGDGSVLPPKNQKSFTYEKQKYYMTPSEYAQYSVIRGQKSFEYADELIRTDDYKKMSPEEKKKALEKCYDAAGDEAKNEILKGRGIDVAAKEAEKAAKKKSKKKTSKKKKK